MVTLKRDYAFPNFTPGKPRLPADFKLVPDYAALDLLSVPVTPTLPPVVVTGDLITAAHANTVRSALSDLWADVQYLDANKAQDPTTAKGDLLARGSSLSRLAVGADGQTLIADSAQALGVKWVTVDAASLGAVPSSRQVLAGPGMSGGGALGADVTLSANVQTVFGRIGDIVPKADDYTAAMVTNAVDTTKAGGYADPAWITSLDWSKITAKPVLVNSFNSRSGAVVPQAGDYTVAQVTGAVPNTLAINTDATLSGGGDLTATRTLSVVADKTLQRVRISKDGGLVGERQHVNFITGANVTLSLADNGTDNRVDVTIASTGSGGGGSQTPWTSDIDGDNHILYDVQKIGIGITAAVSVSHTLVVKSAASLSSAVGAKISAADGRFLQLNPSLQATSMNGLVKQGDIALIFSEGILDTGNLVIGPQSTGAIGLRMLNTGNVGIGNDGTPPVSAAGFPQLVVGPQAASSATCGIITPCGNTTGIANAFGQIAFANYGIAAADKRIANITATTDGASNSAMLQFHTANVGTLGERMRITAAGFVGIGKTPAYALDVAGDCNITGTFRVNGTPISTGGGVTTVFGRSGAVVAQAGDYSASMVSNAVSDLGSYSNPAWITSLAWGKISGVPATGVSSVFGRAGAVGAAYGDYDVSQVVNAVSAVGSYSNPAWIASLAWSKITGAPAISSGWTTRTNYSGSGRNFGTTYQNTTGKIVLVQVSLEATGGNSGSLTAYCSGSNPPSTMVGKTTGGQGGNPCCALSFTVPINEYYKVDAADRNNSWWLETY